MGEGRRHNYQTIVAAPVFCIAVRCDEDEIRGLDCLEPCAELTPQNALAAEAARQLRAWLEDPGFVFSLPLRACGTDFQRRVWTAIARIPCRRTGTYGELAAALGSAPRAVGQACGANPFPLVVPCHRVVAAGGKPGGFVRCGDGFPLEIKRWLLAYESR